MVPGFHSGRFEESEEESGFGRCDGTLAKEHGT